MIHEHTRISAEALALLHEQPGRADLAALDQIWRWAAHHERNALRLCASPCREPARCKKAEDQTQTPVGDTGAFCLGFAPIPALAADHSCSPRDLAKSLSQGAWVQKVLLESNRLDAYLGWVDRPVLERLDRRREGDLALQTADEDYLGRAGHNTSHFAFARTLEIGHRARDTPHRALTAYLERALATGEASNAVALYVNFHVAALRGVARARRGGGAPAEALAGALLAEAHALHFLQDSFSSGHFVGSWGEDALRIGTHDYYCRAGVEARTWSGEGYVAHGDAFLKDEDARRAAEASALSLAQLARIWRTAPGHEELVALAEASAASDRYDVCQSERVPPGLEILADARAVEEVTRSWPMPSLRNPEHPRARADIGPFWGLSVSVDGGVDGRWGPNTPLAADGIGRARAGLRFGYAMEGTLTRYMDGRLFAELVAAGEVGHDRTQIGLGAHLHLPFAWVPILEPVVLFIPLVLRYPPALRNGQLAARGGGLDHFQKLYVMGEDRTFQIEVGRDVTYLRYFGAEAHHELLIPALKMVHGLPYGGNMLSDTLVELGWQGAFRGGSYAIGAYLSLALETRVYFP
jgi:hypothetical protein